MVSSPPKRASGSRKSSRKHTSRANGRKAAILGSALGVAAVAMVLGQRAAPEPKHTSILTGEAWVGELLKGHDSRFQEQLGCTKYVFRRLKRELEHFGLQPSRYVSLNEKLAIFLHLGRTGHSSRMMQERFQRSGDTISKYIYEVLNICVGEFYTRWVQQPSDATPTEILSKSNIYSPYFNDCRGNIDGSHFDEWVLAEKVDSHRDRKGRVSQNVLVACDFDLKFTYVLPGWEGSAADGAVWADARRTDLFIKPGTYLLADAGFPLCDALLTPYRGVRYHLKEWALGGGQQPRNKEELFNLRHARLRNAVERILGVFKCRFGLVSGVSEYPEQTQIKFISAFAAIHNFICVHEPRDSTPSVYEIGIDGQQHMQAAHRNVSTGGGELSGPATTAEQQRARARRDGIAQRMWNDYQVYLQTRG
ncbi:hypothetical protein D9758_004156 [Tetrapyrgos nigripes]|uniref:DDE Tnp4 domain-containing protein n=1 Tax=Tetrapyrgos nigripes TaxID=182062 RepID=A0A8H5LV63_9AGAR|nr:hypothetical protein D9758_004156 [Tetrapyrgos nigripes]